MSYPPISAYLEYLVVYSYISFNNNDLLPSRVKKALNKSIYDTAAYETSEDFEQVLKT